MPLGEAGVQPGDVLVATTGVHRPRRVTLLQAAKNAPESPALAAMIAWVAALVAAASPPGTPAARATTSCAPSPSACCWPARSPECCRSVVTPDSVRPPAPAFAAAAAFAGPTSRASSLLPAVLGAAGISAAVVAGIGRALSVHDDEVSTVWIVSGLTVFACCAVPAMLGWDARVAWTLLVFLSMMAARFAPSLAVDVPDEALLDLDRLAVTGMVRPRQPAPGSPRPHRGRRRRHGAPGAPGLAHRHRRRGRDHGDVLVASPLLLHTATIDLDRIGARCLVFFAGCRCSCRPVLPPRGRPDPLRLAGLGALVALAVHLAAGPGASHVDVFFYVTVGLASSPSPRPWRPAAAGGRCGGRAAPRSPSRCAAASPSRLPWSRPGSSGACGN